MRVTDGPLQPGQYCFTAHASGLLDRVGNVLDGNADGTGGMLSISDGTHSASIALFGQYSAAGFQIGSDAGAGAIASSADPAASTTHGTLITIPNQKA